MALVCYRNFRFVIIVVTAPTAAMCSDHLDFFAIVLCLSCVRNSVTCFSLHITPIAKRLAGDL